MPEPLPPTDAELLARFRAGQDDALGLLFERYEGPVFRFLYGMLRDHHAAEDALQETFVQALRKADAASPATLRGWLFTVAHQQAILTKRRARRAPATAESVALLRLVDDTVAGPEAAVGRADDLRAVRELLLLLPDAQQQVIRLRVFDGLKFREVAEAIGCPLNTALARMHDGLTRLRVLWEARHG
jgi:RNA polymerase sigma-70 factor (ECF subfamily)